MAEKTVPKLTEKEPPTRDAVEVENHVAITKGQEIPAAVEGEEFHVVSHVWFVPDPEAETATGDVLTRETFENSLDKVSRPVKGKYRDALPSSEDLIKDKQKEAELEDR